MRGIFGMSGNELSSQLHMGFTGKKVSHQSARDVKGKVVYRELQAVILMLHIQFFNSPNDLRAKSFAKHARELESTPHSPLDMSLQ